MGQAGLMRPNRISPPGGVSVPRYGHIRYINPADKPGEFGIVGERNSQDLWIGVSRDLLITSL
jgi:hypothetical protein